MAKDLQAHDALDEEYRTYTHGNQFANRTSPALPTDKEIEKALTGGYSARNTCECGIARSRNGASNCSAGCATVAPVPVAKRLRMYDVDPSSQIGRAHV